MPSRRTNTDSPSQSRKVVPLRPTRRRGSSGGPVGRGGGEGGRAATAGGGDSLTGGQAESLSGGRAVALGRSPAQAASSISDATTAACAGRRIVELRLGSA